VRTFPSLVSSRRIAAVGLLAGVLALLAPPAGAGTTERVSVDSAGNEGNSFVQRNASISADGRFVAFTSFATNLVPGDTNRRDDVFVRDRLTGTTELVSVDSAGNQGNRDSGSPAISADGRFVAFHSVATNLVPGDTGNMTDVFVRDRLTGTTQRVSVDSAGTEGNGASVEPAISGDGRFVAFYSFATNLVPGDTNGDGDVFVHDRQTGTTERVSVDSAGNQGSAISDGFRKVSISADGRVVAFVSVATNLVPGDTNGGSDAFVHDRQTGIT
jgi:Tol biopolymer transport system component